MSETKVIKEKNIDYSNREVLVDLENLDKFFKVGKNKTLKAVENVNLKIYKGETFGLVGESGCGKTTLLRMIAGLNSITEGDLIFGEKRVNKLASKDRDIAMVFQNYALYPHMTVFENIAYSMKLKHITKKEMQKRFRKSQRFWISKRSLTVSRKNFPVVRNSV